MDTCFQDPFLFISADWPEDKEDLNSHAYINKSRSVFHEARILNTAHSNFMDIPFMIPLEILSEAGEINPDRGIKIMARLVTGFFDRYLKNRDVDFNSLASEYEHLELISHKDGEVKYRPAG